MIFNKAFAEEIDQKIAVDTETISVQDSLANDVAEPESKLDTGYGFVIQMVLIFAVFYFFIIRPQSQKQKAQQELINQIKIGDKILTNSGIFGSVTKLLTEEDAVMMRIAQDVEIKILKSAISELPQLEKLDDKKKQNKLSSNKNKFVKATKVEKS